MTSSLADTGLLAGPMVASFITDAVGDVSRPRSVLQPCAELDHLPGESGSSAGAKNIRGWRRQGVAYMIDQCKRLGPVHRSQMGALPYVGIADPDLLQRIGRNEDQVWSAAIPWNAIFQGINPASATFDAPVTLDFERHHEARRQLQPAFGSSAIGAYLDIAYPILQAAVGGWVDAGRVDLKSAIRRVLACVSARIFVGISDAQEDEVLDSVLQDIWNATFALPSSRTHRRAAQGYASLVGILRPRVSERRARPGRDLFSRLCASTGGPGWLDDDAIVRLFIGVMAAAFDTTSSGITSMAYLLAKNPDWQARLRAEARTLGPRLTLVNARLLESTERAWKETLRMFPVAPTLPRVALRDVQLGPWFIPAGTFVQGLIGPVLRDPSWWTTPETFDPDRFAPTRAEDRRSKGLFLPFGAGAHACMGAQLAMIEVKAFWHILLTQCRFSLERDYEGHHVLSPLGTVSGDVALSIERMTLPVDDA